MSSKRALQLILGISLFGVAFSGRLSYRELTGATALICPSPGAAGTIFGYPACVYGLLMYSLIAGLAAWGLLALRAATLRPRAEGNSSPRSQLLTLLGQRRSQQEFSPEALAPARSHKASTCSARSRA